jgi:hypothetical protein
MCTDVFMAFTSCLTMARPSRACQSLRPRAASCLPSRGPLFPGRLFFVGTFPIFPLSLIPGGNAPRGPFSAFPAASVGLKPVLAGLASQDALPTAGGSTPITMRSSHGRQDRLRDREVRGH